MANPTVRSGAAEENESALADEADDAARDDRRGQGERRGIGEAAKLVATNAASVILPIPDTG
jgi:hypothetical protein